MTDLNFGEDIELDKGQLPTPENDVLFHGMFMDGFRWDEKEMVATDSIKGIMNSPLCMFNMEHKMDFLSDEADYIVPLQKTSARVGALSTTGE
uniref:Dynein heavy chain 6, axonemal-like n=1 Tax=Crassostrea virginica TaxID=6565 RepID=A0A8B8BTW5_CRAVI|nr:dynein heavy chain 6, axonemal-like [Crassostrea virginica]